MKMCYSLKVYTKGWVLARSIAAPAKAYKTLETLMRLPSPVALTTFYSMAFPIKMDDDVAVVEKAMNLTLDLKRDNYVIECVRARK